MVNTHGNLDADPQIFLIDFGFADRFMEKDGKTHIGVNANVDVLDPLSIPQKQNGSVPKERRRGFPNQSLQQRRPGSLQNDAAASRVAVQHTLRAACSTCLHRQGGKEVATLLVGVLRSDASFSRASLERAAQWRDAGCASGAAPPCRLP